MHDEIEGIDESSGNIEGRVELRNVGESPDSWGGGG